MEYLESEIIECLQEDTDEGKILRACLKSMDINARNVAVELLIWYDRGLGNMPRKEAERIVTDFLQSDYLKERMQP